MIFTQVKVEETDLEPIAFTSHPLDDARNLLMPVYGVLAWTGEPVGAEGQPLAWVTSEELIQHHMCFHSPDSEAVCQQFEARGFERVLGMPGDPQGYFQDPAGLLIEIIGDGLLDYLQGFYQQSLADRKAEEVAT